MGAMALVKRRPISPFKMGRRTYIKLGKPVDTLKKWSQKLSKSLVVTMGERKKKR
jgi:hypothetical protein